MPALRIGKEIQFDLADLEKRELFGQRPMSVIEGAGVGLAGQCEPTEQPGSGRSMVGIVRAYHLDLVQTQVAEVGGHHGFRQEKRDRRRRRDNSRRDESSHRRDSVE